MNGDRNVAVSSGRVITRVFRDDSAEPAGELISPLDRGFILGDALFETVRVYRGHPFRLTEHIERMRRSALHMDIPFPPETGERAISVLDAGERAGFLDGDCALRVTLSRGSDAPGLAPPEPCITTLVVALYELSAGAQPEQHPPLAAVLAASCRNELAATAGHKCVGFADSVLELIRARKMGADDCIFLDTRGHVSEGSASNVFLVDSDALVTPALACGALPGITRLAVTRMAPGLGLSVEERVVEREELELADEVFLTSSLREIAGVSSVNGVPLRSGTAEGRVTRRLRGALRELVEAERGEGSRREARPR
jgi:branched-chain amino acid aminotransferase